MELCDVRMIIGDFFVTLFLFISAQSRSLWHGALVFIAYIKCKNIQNICRMYSWQLSENCCSVYHRVARYIRVRQLVFPKSTTGWRGTYESASWRFRKCLICNVHILEVKFLCIVSRINQVFPFDKVKIL